MDALGAAPIPAISRGAEPCSHHLQTSQLNVLKGSISAFNGCLLMSLPQPQARLHLGVCRGLSPYPEVWHWRMGAAGAAQTLQDESAGCQHRASPGAVRFMPNKRTNPPARRCLPGVLIPRRSHSQGMSRQDPALATRHWGESEQRLLTPLFKASPASFGAGAGGKHLTWDAPCRCPGLSSAIGKH